MKTLTALCVALLLTGCASVQDMRNQPPVLTLKSTNSPRQNAICIADDWDRVLGHAMAQMRENRAGYQIHMMCDTGYNCIVIDITPQDNGSNLTMYGQTLWMKDFQAAVKSCALAKGDQK